MNSRGVSDPVVIARLEAEASRYPVAYRWKLGMIAILGDLALTVTQLAPLAAPIAIGVLWVNKPLYYGLGAAAIALLVWMFRPSFRFHGRELTPAQAPLLFAELASLKQKLDVPGRMRVFLDDSFNASAAETRGLFGIVGTQCALTLGVPLLLALDRDHALAVIAHEFGHFSRRHGRLGQWLYRARVGWNHYAEQVAASDSAFDRAAAWYARQFVPFFSARTFIHSRQCEYEADADAALAVGAKAIAEALTRTTVMGRLWHEDWPREARTWYLQLPRPPEDYYERFAHFAKARPPAKLQLLLDEALQAPADWRDTHPGLSERLRALKQPARLVDGCGNAGEALLGEAWIDALVEFNGRWTKDVRGDWLLEHLRLKHVAERLLSADPKSVLGWPEERRLARARVLRRTRPVEGLAELRQLYTAHPASRPVRFAYAAALLTDNEETGVAIMEKLAREDPAYRVPAFQRVLSYFERKGDARQIERWSAWHTQALHNQIAAVQACLSKAEAGDARPSSLPAGEKAVLAEATRLDPTIADAWLLETTAQLVYADERPPVLIVVHLFAISIDPNEAERSEEDEDVIAARYSSMLSTLVPPHQVAIVRTYFTTENRPDVYASGCSLRA